MPADAWPTLINAFTTLAAVALGAWITYIQAKTSRDAQEKQFERERQEIERRRNQDRRESLYVDLLKQVSYEHMKGDPFTPGADLLAPIGLSGEGLLDLTARLRAFASPNVRDHFTKFRHFYTQSREIVSAISRRARAHPNEVADEYSGMSVDDLYEMGRGTWKLATGEMEALEEAIQYEFEGDGTEV